MIAVFLTPASKESLVDYCYHIEDLDSRKSDVTISPLILNSYPCVEEDLICPFGELVYIKVIST
jgi:hypothetical protein